MPYSASTGVYSATSGAETATAGQTIASATWNQINSDYRTALTALGKGVLPVLTSGITTCNYHTAPVVVNFAASAGDIGIFTIVLPVSVSIYRVSGMKVGSAGGNLNSATVSLFTGAGATGTTVIGSTATTITTSLANTNNNFQYFTPAAANTEGFTAAQLFLHVTASTATSNTATVVIEYQPLF